MKMFFCFCFFSCFPLKEFTVCKNLSNCCVHKERERVSSFSRDRSTTALSSFGNLGGTLGPILQIGNHPVFFEHSTPYSRCIHQTGMMGV